MSLEATGLPWVVMTTRAKLKQEKDTPIRTVPKDIERPEYVWKDTVQEAQGEPFIQTPEVIEAMREASRIAANALQEAGKAVAPGVTTDERWTVWLTSTCVTMVLTPPHWDTWVSRSRAVCPSTRLSATVSRIRR